MEPPEDKLLIACLTELDTGHPDTDDIWINAKTNIAMKLAIEENTKKQELLVELQVPSEYHEFFRHIRREQSESLPRQMTLGSQDRNERRIRTKIVQGLQPYPGRTDRTG